MKSLEAEKLPDFTISATDSEENMFDYSSRPLVEGNPL
jgi:hypothetical protein